MMHNHIGGEVFIVTGAESDEISDIYVTDSRVDLNEHLAQLDPMVDDDIRVFHGVLTYAEYIPQSFTGRSAYIIVEAADQPGQGCVVEGSETPEEMASEIETVIESSNPMIYGNIGIDDIYILYGYQIGVCYAINEDDVDDEVIFACELIADEVADVRFASIG